MANSHPSAANADPQSAAVTARLKAVPLQNNVSNGVFPNLGRPSLYAVSFSGLKATAFLRRRAKLLLFFESTPDRERTYPVNRKPSRRRLAGKRKCPVGKPHEA